MLDVQPIEFDEACEFIDRHHSHHVRPQGWKFGLAVNDGVKVVGVAMCGRPVSRHKDDGWTLEVIRCCEDTCSACKGRGVLIDVNDDGIPF